MKKLVFESLDELFEAKDPEAAKVQKKLEQPKATKAEQTKREKIEQAIKGLEAELKQAKKPGQFKSTMDKNAKIKLLQDKIAAWKKKLK